MGKIVETRELYKDTINDITKSEDNWLSFLKTASWNFKYNFNDSYSNAQVSLCALTDFMVRKIHIDFHYFSYFKQQNYF